MFDPNKHSPEIEAYISNGLEQRVEFIKAERLTKSTRQAPWRLDVNVKGHTRSYVLQLDTRGLAHEYQVLKAMESIPVPTPNVYGLDLEGKAIGVVCFFSDFIAGDSLLGPLQAGESWAEDLYVNSVCALQSITEEDLGDVATSIGHESAKDVLENAYTFLKEKSLPLADMTYSRLKADMPELPLLRFSNGDLWLDNFIVQDKKLAGVIDFQGAVFSDPLFEFLLSFFVSPALQVRGIEERYCRSLGYDPAILQWYHGLEFFDTWHWLLKTGEDFVHHTAESIEANLQHWLDSTI